jgi:membrane-associated phospholipid phosphatase
MNALLTAVTNCGDLALLLPVAGVIALWLVGMRLFRVALWWGVAIALCTGGTAVFKIYFYACPPLAELHSPSGHTALSTLVYGAVALIVAVEGTRRHRLLTYVAGATLIFGVAVSRVLLHAHSPLEAGLGLVIGLGALAVFAGGYLARRSPEVSLRPLVVSIALLVVILHGQELRAEELLHAISNYLQIADLACG